MIRYGILGCGGHALDAHALPAKDIPEFKLTALCDLKAANMAALREKIGSDVPAYQNEKEFWSSGIDAVVIATLDECHTANLQSAIEAGVHTLIEKPLAINREQLQSIKKLLTKAADRKLVVSSCHPRRFDPPFIWAKKKLPTFMDKFGKILHLDFDFSYHEPTAPWKHNRSLLLDHLNHEVDLMGYLFGRDNFMARPQSKSFDHYEVTGDRDDGISFHFHGTRRLQTRRFYEWMRLRFDRGEVKIDTKSGQAEIMDHETGTMHQENCGATNYVLRSRAVMQNFANAISGTEQCYLTPRDLVVNTETGIALEERNEACIFS